MKQYNIRQFNFEINDTIVRKDHTKIQCTELMQ